ncbi:MAG: EipB family protein [Alphaproteobacteria bacterium]
MSFKFESKTQILLPLYCAALLGVFYPHVSFAALDRAREAGLTPHKALYEIKLLSKKSSAKVSNIHGKMFYEWQPSCDAWITNHRFDVTYEYIEAPAMRITSNFSTYEAYDGKSFNFSSERKSEGILLEEIRGSVSVNDNGQVDEAVYTIPEDLVFDLPEGTLFPMAHTLGVLDKIKNGQKIYSVTLFDGSDNEGPVDVNSVIGKPRVFKKDDKTTDIKHDIDMAMVNAKGWNIRLAFFPLNTYESASDYEMSVLFHENGVISNMEVDYGDFAVTQKLLAVEPLGDACEVHEKQEAEK